MSPKAGQKISKTP